MYSKLFLKYHKMYFLNLGMFFECVLVNKLDCLNVLHNI